MFRQGLDLTLRLYTAPTDEDLTSFINNNKKQEVLQLFFKSKEQEDAPRREEAAVRRVAIRLRSFRYYTPEEEAEEARNGVSTRLALYQDPWMIKKLLQQSDVNKLCRLMIPKRLLHQHVIPEWRRCGKQQDVNDLENNRELQVRVWDCDRSQEYVLTLRKHESSDCYVFRQNWSRQFVVERGLKKGDNIGMFWCSSTNRFYFKVLDRAPKS